MLTDQARKFFSNILNCYDFFLESLATVLPCNCAARRCGHCAWCAFGAEHGGLFAVGAA